MAKRKNQRKSPGAKARAGGKGGAGSGKPAAAKLATVSSPTAPGVKVPVEKVPAAPRQAPIAPDAHLEPVTSSAASKSVAPPLRGEPSPPVEPGLRAERPEQGARAGTGDLPERPAAPDRGDQGARRAAGDGAADPGPGPASSASRTAQDAAPSFALSISSTKLAVARFAIFAILALDAILSIPHAARYGAGFNVSHLPIFPAELAPDRALFLYLQCAIAGLCSLVAVGAGGRSVPIALTVLYAWGYFSSQLDSYQHHYLVWLLLFVWCFVPPPSASEPPPLTVRSSALRVLLILLGIVYLWAAISKMEPRWLDGTAMSMQIRGLLREIVDETIGIKIVSRLVIVTELGLAVTIWRLRAWRWAWPLGLGMHGVIAFSGLEIGLFSYLMFAVYLLVIPEPYGSRLLSALSSRVPAGLRRAFAGGDRMVAAALWIIGATCLLLLPPPLSNPLTVAFAIGWIFLILRWMAPRFVTRAAAASATLMIAFLAADLLSQVSVDYFRYWGGSARRLGKPAEAEQAYRGLIAVAPELELGHYHLGRLLIRRQQLDAGLVHLRQAESLDPKQVRALDEQVRALAAAGRAVESRQAAARAQARRALSPSTTPAAAPPGSSAPAAPAAGRGPRGDGEIHDQTDENVEAGVQDEPSR